MKIALLGIAQYSVCLWLPPLTASYTDLNAVKVEIRTYPASASNKEKYLCDGGEIRLHVNTLSFQVLHSHSGQHNENEHHILTCTISWSFCFISIRSSCSHLFSSWDKLTNYDRSIWVCTMLRCVKRWLRSTQYVTYSMFWRTLFTVQHF